MDELKLEVLGSLPKNEWLERDWRRRMKEKSAVRRAEREKEGEEAEGRGAIVEGKVV